MAWKQNKLPRREKSTVEIIRRLRYDLGFINCEVLVDIQMASYGGVTA